MSNNWSVPTNPDTVRRRAGGRRRYNAHRKNLRAFRRQEVAKLLLQEAIASRGSRRLTDHGLLARIARQLGVSRSTICRDRQWLLEQSWIHRCPRCGEPVPPYELKLVDLSGVPIEEAGAEDAKGEDADAA